MPNKLTDFDELFSWKVKHWLTLTDIFFPEKSVNLTKLTEFSVIWEYCFKVTNLYGDIYKISTHWRRTLYTEMLDSLCIDRLNSYNIKLQLFCLQQEELVKDDSDIAL